MTRITHPSQIETVASRTASPGLTRRGFLKRLGVGTGAVVVVAAGGIAWRAVDQGVLAPGTGPAFEPWHADLTTRDPLSLVGAAILAANAHDSQPWLFSVSADRIDLYADTERSLGALDPIRREMDLSLGCALENLVLAAKAHGYAAAVTLLPTTGDATHVARVDLSSGPVEATELYGAIASRHTDRAAYQVDRAVAPALLDQMTALADSPETALVWLTTDEAMGRFGTLTIESIESIIADPQQAHDDFAWYRQDWADIQKGRDGITMDAGGLGEIARLVVRMLPPSGQAAMQQGWIDATRDRQLPTAQAFGVVAVRDPNDRRQRYLAGRLFQRIHLHATTRQLALQPLNQILERADREQDLGLESTFGRALDGLTPTGWRGVMAFRIGYPTAAAEFSPRRPVEAVLQRNV